MNPEEIAAKEAAAKAEAEKKQKAEADVKALENDAIKKELEKSQQRKAYSDKERAEYNLKKQAEKIKELGGDPAEILGVHAEGTVSDNEIPGWYKAEKAKDAEKTSSQLADALTDPDERALTKEYLANRIKSQGDPQDDFRLALSAVRALKNKEILEDVLRRTSPRRTAAGGSGGNTEVKEEFIPTTQEAIFMKPPYSLSKEKILEVRKKMQES